MSREIGTLIVVVLKARNLRDKHTITKQDVYTQASLNKVEKKTATDVKGGQHPVWDEELRFPIVKAANDETRKLEIVIYSKEPRQDDLVGKGSVDISETLKTGEFDDWVELFLEDGSQRGEIFLEMTFYANAPPPQRRPSKWKPADRLKRGPNGLANAVALKANPLPPLPEDPDVALPLPGASSPPKLPSSLLPGGGGPKRTSPKAVPPDHSVRPQAPRSPSPPGPVRNGRQSLDNIPAHLRPGGGAARPTHSHQSSITSTPDAQARRSSYDSIPPYLQPGGSSHPVPSESVSPYLQPGAGGSPGRCHSPPRNSAIPEPHIPTPEISSYGVPSQTASYGGAYGASPYPPQSSYAEYPSHRSQSPPAHFVGGISSPPPQQQQQQYPAYGSPPRAAYQPLGGPPPAQEPYPPLVAHPPEPYPPYGTPALQTYAAPPAQLYGVPAHQTYGATPQAYPPHGTAPPPSHPPQPHAGPQSYPPYGAYPPPNVPSAGLNLPDPYLEKRYQSPLPLPDGSFGRAPTPSHSHSHSQPQPKTSIPVPQPTPAPVAHTTPAPKPQAQAQQKPEPKGPSREEQDRSLALELEKQEEERKRQLREQEERDMELARQLDLELNI
ncbi:hypothetical protein GSI_02442 [Ganoderma sinense ZZ0214-1]|uniref:C2 domain-containing protein n=1 Tax=Ganoderma sinense ZZ0214-1 TaxID=1077348 RepID=A0A2G8SPP6_9APHY|nr:hypothetical protein GSI_02442 [Ganoderma sinense ZZ0214-1]